jgi:hypothetical protein
MKKNYKSLLPNPCCLLPSPCSGQALITLLVFMIVAVTIVSASGKPSFIASHSCSPALRSASSSTVTL